MEVNYQLGLLLIILISRTKIGMATDDGRKECILPLKPDWSFFSPLIFTTNGTLITRANYENNIEDISLQEGAEVLLSCTPNYFRDNSAEKVMRALCKEEHLLVVNGEEKDFVSELSCEARVIEEIVVPINGCPKNIKSIEFGYTNPIKQKSYVLGEACYSTKGGRTIFAHMRLRSQNMDVQELALKVKNVAYFRQEHPTAFYRNELIKALRRDEHEEFLTQTLGTKSIPKIGFERFINSELLTHRQYQSIVKLSWNYAIVSDPEELSNLGRLQADISMLNFKHIDFYTGTHGTLTMKNSDGENVELFLKENKFPVPKYIWYVVRSENKATAFAIHNTATVNDDEVNQKDYFCKSKCDEISWLNKLAQNQNYQKHENGFVLCCDFHEFRQVVNEMPYLDNINDLLK